MSGANTDLAARLALLATETPEFDGDQRLLPMGDAFANILHLIDETVIPAVLEISNGNEVLCLEIAGRRLSRLPGVIEDLTADDADALNAAAAQIVSFADAADTALRVREITSDATSADPAQSVSIKALAAAAGRPLIDANAPLIDQFRARLGDAIVSGQLTKGGKVSDTFGDITAVQESIRDLTALAGSAPDTTPSLILFEVEDENTPFRGAIKAGTDGLAFAANGVSIGAIRSAFQESKPN